MKIIERKEYIDQLLRVKNIPDIKVITGIRRSGKSKLMDAFEGVISKESTANIIHIKLNLKKFEKLLYADDLYEYIDNKYDKNKINYLLIDEIQMCENFERVINSLYEEERFDIYITGSNAFLLSSDLATLFGGRVYEISMFPFSFSEYLKYYDVSNIDTGFDNYIVNGGMSGSYLYSNKEDARKYVSQVLRTTIVKDIIKKYKIENEELLLLIADYLMDNVGKRSSIRNVANKLTAGTYKTNDKTVGAYILYLCRSFLFYPIQRYDVRGKKYLESEKKYYMADLSFRFAEIGSKTIDYGFLYENIVALELLRRGFELYVGQLYDKEIDFVAIKNGIKTYIQVADDITNESTFTREIKPLMSIKDAYPKMIIARTKHEDSQYEGIVIKDIARWLIEGKDI